ncbi:34818_t:CDS:2, partial [Gigaspora margarita]
IAQNSIQDDQHQVSNKEQDITNKNSMPFISTEEIGKLLIKIYKKHKLPMKHDNISSKHFHEMPLSNPQNKQALEIWEYMETSLLIKNSTSELSFIISEQRKEHTIK